MDLKDLLGEELYNQVIAKAGDKHKIAIVSDGNWFPKEKFDEVYNAKKQAETDLKERDKQLNQLQEAAKGNEEMQATIKKLQDENKVAYEKYEAEVKQLKVNTALKLALAGKVHDADLVTSLINKDAVKLKDDGTIESGFEDQIKTLRESKSFLFVPEKKEEPLKFSGLKPAGTKDKNDPPSSVGAAFAQTANKSSQPPAAENNPWA